MGIKAMLALPFARFITRRVKRESNQANYWQDYWLKKIVDYAKHSAFGKDHHFSEINNYEDFKRQLPVRDYEGLRKYVDRVVAGEENVLWPGLPLYFAKTSGTTSGVKYIPVSKQSIGFHIQSARNALLNYIAETGNTDFIDGNLIFLSGSPELEMKNKVWLGRLSGIVNHHVPQYLRKNQLPSYATNCIEDWETKIEKITEETLHKNMTLISGIPPWVQMYFDKLTERTGKLIKDLFPEFNLFVYGGVNFEPYRSKIEKSIGKKIDTIETYPASEGFIAYQDAQESKGLLLLVNNGIFYEFIPVEEYYQENPRRLSLHSVELEVNYALLLTTNAGLYAYSIGDTVKFVSLNPPRIKVTGRIKHFISAFGEHVIGEEVEEAILIAASQMDAQISEFTVAPQVTPPEGGLPYHEWFVSFHQPPNDLDLFAKEVDKAMQQKNIYYKDLIEGGILQHLKLRVLKTDAFIQYMKEEGKLGGQNKVPRLSNDRLIADKLDIYREA